MLLTRARILVLVALFCLPSALSAQVRGRSLYQLSGGFSWTSNAPNGVPGARQGLAGWDASIAALDWHHLRFKMDVSGVRGTNLNAPQNFTIITAGGEYGRHFGREYGFVEGLMGDATINRNWGANKTIGQTATISPMVGGGLDTPIRPRLAFLVKADFLYMNLHPPLAGINSTYPEYPNPVHGLPNYFARLGAGIAWSF